MGMNKETLNAGDLVCVGKNADYCTLTERGWEDVPARVRDTRKYPGWWAFVVRDTGILSQGTMLFLADDLYEIRKVS